MGSHHKGTRTEIRALNSYLKLFRAASSMSAVLARQVDRYGLTETQFGVLDAVYHHGPLSQREIGRKLMKSDGNITTVVGNLERRRLVRRMADSRDRRRMTVHLTDVGRRLIATVLPEYVKSIVEAMSALNASEQAELDRLCKQLGRSLMPGD